MTELKVSDLDERIGLISPVENAPGADRFQEADFSLVIAWSEFISNRASLRLSRIKAYSTRQENVYRRSVVGIPSEVAP